MAAASVVLALVLLHPLTSSGAPNRASPTSPADTARLEQQAYAKVNAYRATKGLRVLTWSDAIAEQARQHSAKMAMGKRPLDHDGFGRRAAAIGRQIAFSRAAENVAMTLGYLDPAAAAMDDWLGSPEHREAIEGNYDLTGVGAAIAPDGAVYFTQIFVKSRPRVAR